MLIAFSTDFVSQRSHQISKTEQELRALEKIGCAAYDGHHRLIGPSEFFDVCAHLPELSRFARAAFQAAKDHRSTNLSLRQRVSHYIEVWPDAIPNTWNDKRMPSEGIPGQDIHALQVPLRWFAEQHRSRPTCLMGENLIDARIFALVAATYASRSDWGLKDPLSFELEGGNGSQTGNRLQERGTGQLVLCLVDSDKKWPHARDGETARDAQKHWKRLRSASTPSSPECTSVTWLEVLNTHELENLLPPRLFRLVYQGWCKPARELVELLSKHPFSGEPKEEQSWRFLDLKAGIKGLDVMAADGRGEWLRTILPKLSGCAKPVAEACQDSKLCIVEKRMHEQKQIACKAKDCDCGVLEPLGSKLLEQVEEYLRKRLEEAHTSSAAAELLAEFDSPENPSRDDWERLSKLVISWGIASPRLRFK